MTYPDRQTGSGRRWLGLVILIFLILYIAFAVEAKARQTVCVSAMTQELGQPPVTSPVVCR